MGVKAFPSHGRLKCRRCFPEGAVEWGVRCKRTGEPDPAQYRDWKLLYCPGHWGSQNPIVLVLGFSKGTTQCEGIATADHNDIPFAGCRPTLTSILRVVGLLGPNQTIDEKIDAAEKKYALASLVRCAFWWMDKKERWTTSGSLLSQAGRTPFASEIIRNCTDEHLANLPPRLKLVALLGNEDSYIQTCFNHVRRLHPATGRINAVAYGDGRVTWVHLAHPSPGNCANVPAFLGEKNSPESQVDKREAAKQAIEKSGVLKLLKCK